MIEINPVFTEYVVDANISYQVSTIETVEKTLLLISFDFMLGDWILT